MELDLKPALLLEALDPVTFSGARTLADRAGRVAGAMAASDAWSITLAALYSPLWLLPLRGGTPEAAALSKDLAVQDPGDWDAFSAKLDGQRQLETELAYAMTEWEEAQSALEGLD